MATTLSWAVGDRVRAVRMMMQLKQVELGELLGVQGPTVAQWELRRQEPRLRNVSQLADVCSEMLGGPRRDWLVYLDSGDESEELREAISSSTTRQAGSDGDEPLPVAA